VTADSPTIRQPERGYRYSLDPFLLAGFCPLPGVRSAVDLGTGAGILPLLIASRSPETAIVGIELQPELARLAGANVAARGLAERVRIIEGDIRAVRSRLPAQSCDLVVSNPPYRKVGSGRQAPDRQRAAARHEQAGGLPEFTAAAAYLLRQGGRFCLIYLAERLAELLAELRGAGIEPKRLRLVHSRPGDEARLVLVEARRGGRSGLKVEPPLYIYAGSDYSAEVRDCYAGLDWLPTAGG